ncbi:MAG: CSLREA domain-containing protein, partial [Flavobacteriales bacterium]|nr:CSLREA domain-containing protein [Flavobacteriales bacterium]
MIYVLVCLSFLLGLTGVQPAYAASYTVTKTADTNDGTCDADCSLREAITAVNNVVGSHVITVPAGTYTLGSQLPQLQNTTITINGAGATTTIIQANASPNVATYRIFELYVAASLTINDVTLQNGRCNGTCLTNQSGGIIYSGSNLPVTINNSIISNGTSQAGGGAIAATSLTIVNTTFSGNTASIQGGAVITTSGTLSITNSTFINNTSPVGGAVATFTTNIISNSTFSGNSGSTLGGAVFNGVGGTLTAVNNTFSANTSPLGAGIYNDATMHLKNNILANSVTGADCYNNTGDTIATNINNLIETNGPSGNKCGTPTFTADPALVSLASNGGATQTFALSLGSVALGAGDIATCASAPINGQDQRGSPRPAASCDLGAFESNQQPGPSFVVNSNADTNDGFCDSYIASYTNCTLREAIAAANSQAGANTITFAGNYTIPLTSTLPIVTTQITITGNGTANTIVQGGASAGVGQKRVFQISSTGNLTLNQLTVQYGSCTGACSGGNGGGALNQGTLTVNNSLFDRNNATNYGGSIANSGTLNVSNTTFTSPGVSTSIGGAIANLLSGTATISNSTFSGNSASSGGGGIYNDGTLTVTNSTFSQNTAGDGGGGLYSNSGSVTISHSSFTDNSSYNGGGAISNEATSTMAITNSTIANNTSTGNTGGGIRNAGTLNIYNSTISGNSSSGGVYDGANVFQSDFGTPELNLYNTIIANSGGSDGDCHFYAGTVNATNTLIESTGSLACGLVNGVNGNIVGSDPNLGSSTGSPAYFPLNTGSPAINAGSNAVCAAAPVNNQSQNGVTRPAGSACDIGSYEVPGGSLPSSPTFSDVPMNHPYWADIEILYANGYTAGCSTTSLIFCPDVTMNRAQSA